MKTYKATIEVNENEIGILVSALETYESKLFRYMYNEKNKENWRKLAKRQTEIIQLLEKIDKFNNPV